MIPQSEIKKDTGWVDITPYLNNQYFKVRGDNYKPMVRKINNVVYFKGRVYPYKNVEDKTATLFSNFPEEFRPTVEQIRPGIMHSTFRLYITYNNIDGIIIVRENTNIETSELFQGYILENLGGYLTD